MSSYVIQIDRVLMTDHGGYCVC